jgi:hypothetical protein
VCGGELMGCRGVGVEAAVVHCKTHTRWGEQVPTLHI